MIRKLKKLHVSETVDVVIRFRQPCRLKVGEYRTRDWVLEIEISTH